MTPEEKAAHDASVLEIKNSIKTIVTDETKADKATILELKSKLEALEVKAKESKEAVLVDEVKKLTEIVGSMKEEAKKTVIATKGKSFADNLVASLNLLKKEDLLALKNGDTKRLQLKTAGTFTTANVDGVGTNSIPFTLADDEKGLTGVSRRNPFILQLCNVGGTNKMYVQWAEKRNPDGGASTTAEGSAKSAADFDIQEVSAKVEKITAYIKLSKESLDDIDFMAAEARGELVELINLKLDSQILLGDGSTPNLNGIITQASGFMGTPFVNAIDYANRFDVLRVAINQILRASGGDSNFAANFIPNYIVLNPDDVTAMELTKNSQGNYLLPPFLSTNGMQISGCQIVANSGMTTGKFLVGDFTKANVRIREGVNVSLGYENADFTLNLVTMLAEMRAVAYIKGNHTNAFVYGTFSTAIAALKDAKS